jgi:hypothetical protein
MGCGREAGQSVTGQVPGLAQGAQVGAALALDTGEQRGIEGVVLHAVAALASAYPTALFVIRSSRNCRPPSRHSPLRRTGVYERYRNTRRPLLLDYGVATPVGSRYP